MSEQLNLEGKRIVKNNTCGDCKFLYQKRIRPDRAFWKCDRKPRGWGYDLKKSQKACLRFRPKIDNQPL